MAKRTEVKCRRVAGPNVLCSRDGRFLASNHGGTFHIIQTQVPNSRMALYGWEIQELVDFLYCLDEKLVAPADSPVRKINEKLKKSARKKS